MTSCGHILVMLPNPLGDAILATPALRQLRRLLPGVRITALGSATVNAILEGVSFIDAFVSRETTDAAALRRGGYDAVIILPNSFRAAWLAWRSGIPRRIGYRRDGRGRLLTDAVMPMRGAGGYLPMSMLDYYGHLIDRAAAALGVTEAQPYWQQEGGLSLMVSEDDRQRADEVVRGYGEDKRLVVMVPGAGFGGSKCWPAERFARLAERLTRDEDCAVLLSGAPDEQALIEQIRGAADVVVHNLADAGDGGLGLLKAVVARAALVVSNDTGPCHVAAAVGTPLVTLFGPTDPRWTVTGYAKEIRLRAGSACSPCQEPVCRRDHCCMDDIGVEEVFGACGRLLCGEVADIAVERAGTFFSVYDESFAPTDDGQGAVHCDYRALLAEHELGTLAEVFAYQQGEQLRKPGLGSRERIRLELTMASGRAVVFYLKRYGQGGQVARREFAAHLTLAEHGVTTARPVGFGVSEERGYVITEELPQAEALERLLPDWEENRERYALLGDRGGLQTALAALVGRLHGSGHVHRDLYLAHVFLTRDAAGNERLALIDLARVFRPRWRERRWRVKDLAQLHYSAREVFESDEAASYLGLDPSKEADRALMRAVSAKVGRIARHDRKKQQRERQGGEN